MIYYEWKDLKKQEGSKSMPPEEITFENAITELETIINKLEEGKLPLESAVSTFERGTYLKKICEEKLKDAQLKIEMLSNKGEESGK